MDNLVAITYLRVSTEQQATSGLGIEAQRDRTTGYAISKGWQNVEIVDNAVSGTITPKDRPGLSQALKQLDRGSANVLIVSSLDRLSRSVRDVLDLADRARRNDWSLAVLDIASRHQRHATGRFLLTVFAALSELERGLISERTTAERSRPELHEAKHSAAYHHKQPSTAAPDHHRTSRSKNSPGRRYAHASTTTGQATLNRSGPLENVNTARQSHRSRRPPPDPVPHPRTPPRGADHPQTLLPVAAMDGHGHVRNRAFFGGGGPRVSDRGFWRAKTSPPGADRQRTHFVASRMSHDCGIVTPVRSRRQSVGRCKNALPGRVIPERHRSGGRAPLHNHHPLSPEIARALIHGEQHRPPSSLSLPEIGPFPEVPYGPSSRSQTPDKRAPAHTSSRSRSRASPQGLPLNRWVKLTVAQRHQVVTGRRSRRGRNFRDHPRISPSPWTTSTWPTPTTAEIAAVACRPEGTTRRHLLKLYDAESASARHHRVGTANSRLDPLVTNLEARRRSRRSAHSTAGPSSPSG